MDQVVLLAFTAALNPTLLAAVTVMLELERPKKLLAGYLLGGAMTSITLGLVIVFAVGGESSGTSTAKHQLNPIFDVAVGALILVCAFVIGTGRDTRRRARKARKLAESKDKPPPRWRQALSGGSARTTFVIGAMLTLPGASYLAALSIIGKEDMAPGVAVLVVVAFNAIMLVLIEAPLVGYALSPVRTAATVERFNAWLARDGGRVALIGAFVIGAALVVRGLVTLG